MRESHPCWVRSVIERDRAAVDGGRYQKMLSNVTMDRYTWLSESPVAPNRSLSCATEAELERCERRRWLTSRGLEFAMLCARAMALRSFFPFYLIPVYQSYRSAARVCVLADLVVEVCRAPFGNGFAIKFSGIMLNSSSSLWCMD